MWFWHQNTSGGCGEPCWEDEHEIDGRTYGDGTTNHVLLVDEDEEDFYSNPILAIDKGTLPTRENANILRAAPIMLNALIQIKKYGYNKTTEKLVTDAILIAKGILDRI